MNPNRMTVWLTNREGPSPAVRIRVALPTGRRTAGPPSLPRPSTLNPELLNTET